MHHFVITIFVVSSMILISLIVVVVISGGPRSLTRYSDACVQPARFRPVSQSMGKDNAGPNWPRHRRAGKEEEQRQKKLTGSRPKFREERELDGHR